MKKTNIILCVVLAVFVIGAAVLGIQLVNTNKELAQTEDTLKTTQTSLTDMTALQGETAATLSQTEETLTAANKELDDTKASLADMTALQGETAATLSQTEETLAATNKELDETKVSLADMTALQEETAGTLKQTEETLTATSKELDETKVSLADMTALQEETAGTLKQTEETLAATNQELEETKVSLADMTALQEETAATLAKTEETLAATTKELEETKVSLADMTALQQETEAALKAAQDELAAYKEKPEPAAEKTDEPAWTAYTYGGYTVPVLDGWTRYKEGDDGTLKYYYYGSSFIMVGDMTMPKIVTSETEIIDVYEGIAQGYISGGMTEVSQEYFEVDGNKAHYMECTYKGLPVDMILYYAPGDAKVLSFSYVQVDGDSQRREQIVSLAKKYITKQQVKETPAPAAPAAVDYPDDAKFEADLNAGKDLTGKTVTFKIVAYKPTSALGYNLWAGEHLNFVSDTPPQFTTVGEKVTVRVTQVKKTLGSFVIRYEVVE